MPTVAVPRPSLRPVTRPPWLRRVGGGAVAVLLALASPLHAQPQPVNGMRPADLRLHAIVGATVVPAPGERLEGATVLMRDGVIEAVGAEVEVPEGARIWDGTGLTVYAGLIDAAVLVDAGDTGETTARHWNANVRPEVRMHEQPLLDAGTRSGLREMGFTAAAVHASSRLFRGTGTVVALVDDADHGRTYVEHADMMVSIDPGRRRGGSGPGSLMGGIALVRQTLLDADWHADRRAVYDAHPDGNEPPAPSAALDALATVIDGEQTVLFDVDDELDALRVAAVADEFGLAYRLLGSGYEFRRLDEIADLDVEVIVPLRFPEAPDLSTVTRAQATSLRNMMTWEQAPTNARRLVARGVPIALTTHRLKSRKAFRGAVREAIRHGLSEDDALAALTTAPAAMLGLDHVMGTIEAGKVANLVVVEGGLFDKKAKIRDTWINGRRHEINRAPEASVKFDGILEADGGIRVHMQIDTAKPSASFRLPDEEKKAKAKSVTRLRDQLSIVVDGRPFGREGYVRLSGVLEGEMLAGVGVMPDGQRFAFTVLPDPDAGDDADEAEKAPDDAVADAGDDADAPDDAGAADPLTGSWALMVDLPGRGDFPVDVKLELAEDGSVTGVMAVMGREIELDRGSFDPATGKLEIAFEGMSGPATVEATIVDETLSGTMRGEGMEALVSGDRSVMVAGADETDAKEDAGFEMPPETLPLPLGAYGVTAAPEPRDVLLVNATLWTCGPDGVIENGAMLVRDGRIAGIYEEAPTGVRAERIDLDGRHVTPGLLDCHSHTGISGGVNEFMGANTAEVRIGDVINPDDVNWYRQLAGGLTAVNQLHGSANPIGGQNSVVKLKWGQSVDAFRIDGAPGGIKFALGENVKRRSGRYPDTRMGVETFIRDAFTAAREYADARARYAAMSSRERERTMPPRRDLELDALVDIMEGRRLVHCHSYRQDEILMLVRVADDFGFTIGTFQHVLEGYKVAEAIAAHGAGASSFSDWWAYKVEVMDAIPHNGALMTDVGVLVSFNSDSSELARRMNTEASKAVRYGGLEPAEALKLVTLNPAIQLGVGDRIGSLEKGKDADFAIWSGDPLSTYSICEQTWIEGACYFDRAADLAGRARVTTERERLIQKVLAKTHGKAPPPGTVAADEPASDAPPFEPGRLRWMIEQVARGEDPLAMPAGVCGCDELFMHDWSAH